MTRKHLLAFVALAVCIGTAGAQSANGRITFEGRVVQSTCSTGQPLPGKERGDGCSQQGPHTIVVESMTPAAQAADSALLDYFLERTQGDAKFALTRQYR